MLAENQALRAEGREPSEAEGGWEDKLGQPCKTI